MSKKRMFYTKDFNIKYFVCGETVCFNDCDVCLQLDNKKGGEK